MERLTNKKVLEELHWCRVYDEKSKDSYLIPYNKAINYDIIKTSKNIEDLFDLIVLVKDNKHQSIVELGSSDIHKINKEHSLLNQSDFDKKLMSERIRKTNDNVYGAIWTKNGLKYVAKLNEEGEWETL